MRRNSAEFVTELVTCAKPVCVPTFWSMTRASSWLVGPSRSSITSVMRPASVV